MEIKKLSNEEFENLRNQSRGRKGSSAAFNAIIALAVGEQILIPKESHTGRQTPLVSAMRIEKRYKRRFEKYTLIDGSGWIVKRSE